ncbi:MAG: hypothetical protein OEV40_30475 [Acidimicrobiia bacterium]|nr:hypothetical protein [Acidimicrobiia bacterium]
MTVSPLHRCLVAARSAISGEFSSTSRIVDTLLDLRQLTQGESETAALIDSILATVPGRSVVTNEWWSGILDGLEREAGRTAQFSGSNA